MSPSKSKLPPILPDSVPVVMPDLPARLTITTAAQLSALGDPLRERILAIIQQHPRTAKQLATQLNKSTGSIGHQLRVLERAGLARIVARRMTRGIVANHYARTARIFMFDQASPAQRDHAGIGIVRYGFADLSEAVAENPTARVHSAYPRVRLSDARARYYARKLDALVGELLAEPQDQAGETWGMLVAFFEAPRYVSSAPEGPAAVTQPPKQKRAKSE
jgi:DNA-binding transcriptional ArsR family regulator